MASPNGLKREAAPFDTPPSGRPTKVRRALAACKNCRRQKTRCDHTGASPCHRCRVLRYRSLVKDIQVFTNRLDCEYDNDIVHTNTGATPNALPPLVTSPSSNNGGDIPSSQRMDRFESRYAFFGRTGLT